MPSLPKYNSDALLTKTRRAVWDAIDNWQPLVDWEQNTGDRIYRQRMEDDLNELLSSSDSPFFDLPSITVRPGQVGEAWEVNRMAKFADQILIEVKTNYLDQAEEISEMVFQAIWQSCPANKTVSYIKLATGRYPKGVSISRAAADFGKQKIWLFTLTITLEANQDLLSTVLQARVAV